MTTKTTADLIRHLSGIDHWIYQESGHSRLLLGGEVRTLQVGPASGVYYRRYDETALGKWEEEPTLEIVVNYCTVAPGRRATAF